MIKENNEYDDEIKIFALIHGENEYNKYIRNLKNKELKDDLIYLFRKNNKEEEIIKEICKTILEIELDGI
jgi:hypothetical protein